MEPLTSTPETETPDAPRLDGATIRARKRAARRVRQTRRTAITGGVLAGVLVTALCFAWIGRASHGAAAAQGSNASTSTNSSQTTGVAAPVATEAARPTPYFAERGSLKLRLPVPLSTVNEIGFHQASYNYALAMDTRLPDATLSDAKANKGTGRDVSAQDPSIDAWLTGSVIRMWRSRPGKPNTAADVGSVKGAPVISPVTGTVLLVKHYKLYGRYDDTQIHISPDGHPGIDCTVIHVTDPLVTAGQRVTAGVTRIASVRDLASKFRVQLKSYTRGPGNHVHIQLNDVDDPKYEGLEGAIAIPGR